MTNNQLTEEELQTLIIELQQTAYRLNGTNSAYLMSDAIKPLRELQERRKAAMDSEPVAVIDQANLDYLRSGADADVWPPEREEMGDVLLYRHAQPEKKAPDCANAEFGTYSGQINVIAPNGKVAGIDSCILSEVLGLWGAGITTIESCCGHSKASSYIAVAEKDAGKMRGLGYELDESHPSGCVFYSKTSRHGRVTQPAPVVPDGSDPRDAFEAAFPMPKHVQRCGAGYAVTSYGAWVANDYCVKWEGWIACRAAMLQAGNCRENANSSTNNCREIAETSTNSPVIGIDPASGRDCSVEVRYVAPPGYVMVPKEPTEAMINAWLSEVANWRGHVAGYKAMLAAAPQEVKGE